MNDLHEIVESYLAELLTTLANESKRDLTYQLFDVADPTSVVSGVAKSDEPKHQDASIEVRLFRRQPKQPTRFTLQGLTRDLSPETGFSGFVVSGRLASPAGVEILSRMNSYNSNDWESKLVIN